MNKQTEWDIHFLLMAKFCSRRSKDPSTKTGAVIVRPNKSVCSVGFNGFPQSMPDILENYENREEKYSRVIHAEMNAILLSQDPSMHGYTLYIWPFTSCDRCCVHAVQKGITRFIWPEPDAEKLSRWGESFEKTKKYLKECGIEYTEITMETILKEGKNEIF